MSELRPDAENANLGTKRGREFIDESLKKFGLGRSILLDRNGSVMAGNKTLEAFRKAGGKDVLVVRTRGEALIAVQRDDLDLKTKKGRGLAVADNRSSELGLNWSTEALASYNIDLGDFFTTREFSVLTGPSPEKSGEPETSEVVVVIRTTREQLNKIIGTLDDWKQSGIQIDIS